MSGKPRRTTPASVPGAVSVPGGREPDVVEPEAALSPPRRVASGPKPPSTSDADAAAKQRGRRVARPVAPGAVSVPPVEPAAQEPYSAAVQPARAAARSDAAAKNRGRATARATAPGAVSVSMQEPESAQAPSLRQAGRAAAEEVAVAPVQTTRNADAAAKRRGRATARAMAPGAVSVSAEEPEAAPPSIAAVSVAPAQTMRSADAAAKRRGRATARAMAPGAVSVSAEEPEATPPSTSRPMSTAEKDAAAKRRGRRTSQADTPGAVAVGALAPTEMATTGGDGVRSELSVPAVQSNKMRKSRRGPAATTPGAMRVDGNTETPADRKGGRNVVMETTTTTTTVAAYGMSKPARVSTGTTSVPGAVSVVQQEQSAVSEPSEVMYVQEQRDESEKKTGKRLGNMGSSTPGAMPMDGSDAIEKDPTKKKLNSRQNSSDDYMQRMEAKVKQMETDYGEPEETPVPEEDPLKKDIYEDEPPSAGVLPPVDSTPPFVTTADHGVAGMPELEHGIVTGGGIMQPGYDVGGIEDQDLAVAIRVEEEEDPLFAAVEYDPDSKPALHHNRRFRLYFIGAVLLLIVICVGVGVGIGARRSPAPPATLPPTGSPTVSPSLSGDRVYRESFAAVVGSAVHDPTTPQYRAADWIINDDPMQLPVENPFLVQRYLCVLFWVVTTNDGERPWRSCNPPQNGEPAECQFLRFTRQNNDEIVYVGEPAVRWLTGEHECKWVGNLCDDNSVTRAFELWGQNITGTLPTELTQFPFLQSISLPWNDFTGTLPVEYARMKHLLNLEVHGNNLEGSIPVEYWSANALQNFNIGENMMTGSLSSEVGLLSNLRGLHVFENMFTGSFPTEIGGLGFLSYSRFNNNGFAGTIPSELGELVQLQELWMQVNSFNGTVPTTIGNMKDSLVDLRLAENGFSGNIPEELYSLSLLFRLDLQENSFDGTFSTSIGQLTNLEILRVSRNQLTGPYPVQLANIARLRLAWLHLNLFTGNVPNQYCLNRGPGLLEFLSSDCGPAGMPATPCACCTNCCDRSSGFCLLQ